MDKRGKKIHEVTFCIVYTVVETQALDREDDISVQAAGHFGRGVGGNISYLRKPDI
jgi:hypothetical protein